MPYVKIEVTREGVSNYQKKELIKGVTDLLVKILNKNPEHTHVTLHEIETDNWGVAGQQVTELRKESLK